MASQERLARQAATARSKLSAQQQAQIAYMRFGLGPKPDTPLDHWRRKGAAYAALRQELSNPTAVLVPDVAMNLVKPSPMSTTSVSSDGKPLNLYGVPTALQAGESVKGQDHIFWLQADLRARHRKAQEPTIGFVERLVLFWSNHFSIHWFKDIITRGSTGLVERKAIRPHVLGKFPDMLKAVMTQPAMLTYLDGHSNIGPNSNFGGNDVTMHRRRHLNENLAREILELHTVGRFARYEQLDVLGLAKILTGFAYDGKGLWVYWKDQHEHGDFTVLGKTYPQTYSKKPDPWQKLPAKIALMTVDQAFSVLNDLARHPATGKHLATKLIRHFITDNPSRASVDYLAEKFGSDGNLAEMSMALLDLPEAWTWRNSRLRTPQLTLASMNRALGFSGDQINALSSQRKAGTFEGPLDTYLLNLGQGVWSRITPDGYPDLNLYWQTSNAMRLRRDLTYQWMKECKARLDSQGIPFTFPNARARADSLFKNRAMRPESLDLVATSTNDPAANLALLFLTVEYLRR